MQYLIVGYAHNSGTSLQHAQLSVLCGEASLNFKVGLYTTSVLVEQQTVYIRSQWKGRVSCIRRDIQNQV